MMRSVVLTLAMTMALPAVAAETIRFSNVVTEVGHTDLPTSVYVIQDQSAWEEVWAQRHAGSDPPPPLPPVDFERTTIIGFYAGGRPSGGYRVQIKRIVKHTEKITLEVEEKVPAKDCVVIAVVTSPYTFVSVDKLMGRQLVDFRLAVTPVSCDGS